MLQLDLAEQPLRAAPLRASLIRSYTGSLLRPAGPACNLQTAAAPGTAMESANCAPAECWGPPSLDFIVLPPLNGVRWAGFLLLLAASLGILFLVLGGVLSPETDLGFWSALSLPYAIARVLLAVFPPRAVR
jgi:hypothetical protein